MAHTETSRVRPRTLDLLYRVEAIERQSFLFRIYNVSRLPGGLGFCFLGGGPKKIATPPEYYRVRFHVLCR